MTFSYDDKCHRTSKTVDEAAGRYIWSADGLTSQRDGTHEMYFYYDGGNLAA